MIFIQLNTLMRFIHDRSRNFSFRVKYQQFTSNRLRQKFCERENARNSAIPNILFPYNTNNAHQLKTQPSFHGGNWNETDATQRQTVKTSAAQLHARSFSS
jgi:hypothetical protein